MDPAVPWQYTYNRLAAQGAASGELHHHFAQAANNSALTGGHSSSVSAVPSTTSQLLLQAAHSTPLGASTASFATPSSFLSAPSYDVFSPLFHHANPKPAHFNTINAAAQHRQQVLAAQAAVTKQTTDSDIIRENYTQHHSSISTPQTGSYFEQPGGSAVAAALGWQARGGQTDFTTLRSQGDLNSNNQLPSAFGILPHENVSSSPAPSAAAAATKSSSTGVYESFNAHFPQPLNQANAIIKSSTTARSMSPQQQQQSQQQIKQQNIASTSASSAYYQTPSTYQNLQSSFANSKSISQQEQLQHQQAQHHSSYSNNSNQQAISGSKSSFSVSSTGISSSSQLNSSSDPSTSSISKDYSNSSHHNSSRVKSERSNSPVITSHNFTSSAAFHKLTHSPVSQVQTKAALKAIAPNSSITATQSLNHNHIVHGHGQGQVSAIHENNVIQSSPISFSMLENQVAYSSSNNNHNINSHSASRNASSVRKLSTTPLLKQEFQHDSASTISAGASASSLTNSHPTDCSNIVIPRRPSPHQISSQPSPLSIVPSPAYPMYNSPSMNSSQSPIDASTSRTSSKSNCSNLVAYSSVIQRTAHPLNWDGGGGGGGGSGGAGDDGNPGSLQNNANHIYNQTPAQITKLHQISPVHSQQSSHFDSSQSAQSHQNQSNLAAQKLNNSAQQMHDQTCTDYALDQQRSRQSRHPSSIPIDKNKRNDETKARPGRKKRVNDRADSCEKLPSPSTCSEYYVNERIPPPAHIPNQQSMNGSTISNFNNIHSHNSAMISHPSHHHAISHHPYFPSFSMPLAGIGDYSNDLSLNSIPMVANVPYNDSLGTPSVSSNYSPTASEIREDEPPKVVVPNIEEELGFLTENSRSGSIQQANTQMSHQASSAAAATTQNHLTLLGATNNSLSHHNQSNQQHLQHQSHANNQNVNHSQSNSSNPMNQQKTTPLTDKKFPQPTGPGSGFMASYLKFLQGERDTSPPPNRPSQGRKTWSRATTNQPVINQTSPANAGNAQAKNQMSNGMNLHSNMMGSGGGGGGGGGVYDRKRSADDDEDTSDSSNNKQVTNRNSKKQSQQQTVVERAPQVPINAAKKARTTQSSHNNSLLSSQQSSNHALSLQQNNPHGLQQNPQLLMQQHASPAHQLVAGTSQILSQQQMYYPQDNEDPLIVPQRRETSHRKAKGRSILNALQKQTFGADNQNDDDEPPEFVDSDSDPAWTPQKEDDDDDDVPRRKNTRKTRTTNARPNTKRTSVKSNPYPGNTDAGNTEYSNSNASAAQESYRTSNNPDEFQTGDFIVSRQDALLDWPAIWRVDSKTLLQKFEPFHSNNKTIYRSLSTYAQWTSDSCRSYILVKCIHIGQLQHEMHVELQRSELCAATSEMYIEKVMQEAFASLQDQFEVYIQTLISQALDSNFLKEIMLEQDEYFLSNVKTIDDLTAGRKMRLRNTMAWPTRILHSIEIWPCYNVINDLGVTNNGQIICVACNKRNIVSRVILYGNTYNENTIENTQLDGRYSFDKDFLLCRNCVMRCELLHKISHQKYLMFMQCSKKVAELNQQDPTKGSTVILNELLADEAWLSELFGLVRRAWAEVDQIERQHRFMS